MTYKSICKIDVNVPLWFERKSIFREMPINLRSPELIETQHSYCWEFSSALHFKQLERLSDMIAENPRLTTTWIVTDPEACYGSANLFTLNIDGIEIVSCDFRSDTYEFGLNLENLNKYIANELDSSHTLFGEVSRFIFW